jgi:hypothetical protein
MLGLKSDVKIPQVSGYLLSVKTFYSAFLFSLRRLIFKNRKCINVVVLSGDGS